MLNNLNLDLIRNIFLKLLCGKLSMFMCGDIMIKKKKKKKMLNFVKIIRSQQKFGYKIC